MNFTLYLTQGFTIQTVFLQNSKFLRGQGSGIQSKPRFQCQKLNISTGKSCDRIFTRAYNLQRHKRDLHPARSIIIFVQWNQDGNHSRIKHLELFPRQLPNSSSDIWWDIFIPQASALEVQEANEGSQNYQGSWSSQTIMTELFHQIYHFSLSMAPVIAISVSVSTQTSREFRGAQPLTIDTTLVFVLTSFTRQASKSPPTTISIPTRATTPNTPLVFTSIATAHHMRSDGTFQTVARSVAVIFYEVLSLPTETANSVPSRGSQSRSNSAALHTSSVDYRSSEFCQIENFIEDLALDGQGFNSSNQALSDFGNSLFALSQSVGLEHHVERAFGVDKVGFVSRASNIVRKATRLFVDRCGDLDSDESGPKRRRMFNGVSRVFDARLSEFIPKYLGKMSKKIPRQPKGLDWLTISAKIKLDETHERFLAQWGIKSTYKGTCVLLAEEWKGLESLKLMELFETYKYFSRGAGRAWYFHSDHATSLARAVAWFGDWPRTGVELDNFLGCGPFKSMDASHLCYHDHCIVHFTYESADINQDRNECCKLARFLRQQGLEVPDHCSRHSPSCLMQVCFYQSSYNSNTNLSSMFF